MENQKNTEDGIDITIPGVTCVPDIKDVMRSDRKSGPEPHERSGA